MTQAIFVIRGRRVILDQDLAKIYRISFRKLQAHITQKQMLRQNLVLMLTPGETRTVFNLKRNTSPPLASHTHYACTEYGAIAIAYSMNNARSIQACARVLSQFVNFEEVSSGASHRVDRLEPVVAKHDATIHLILETLHELLVPYPETNKQPLGFTLGSRSKSKS